MLNTITSSLKPSSIKKYYKEHRKKSILLTLILIGVIYGGITLFAGGDVTTTYAVANVTKGDIVSTVSASGQVSATNEVELTSKNSGKVLSVKAVTGQTVKSGAVIAQVEAKDAYYAYQSAKISYDKLMKPADKLTSLQAENGLIQANSSLDAYYADAVSEINSIFIDMPKILDGLNTMFYTSSGTLNNTDEISLPTVARSYKTEAGINLDKTKREFDSNFIKYKAFTTQSSTDDAKKLIDTTYSNLSSLIDTVKGTKNTLDYLQSTNNTTGVKNFSAAQSDVNTWLSTINSHLTKLASVRNNISTAGTNIVEKQTSLAEVYEGADALDIQSARLNLQQRAEAYNDSYIKAPFDGVIAKVDVKKGDSVSSGAAIGTIITKQKIVSVDLNEVDISKVKIGQTADVTFDAIDDFTATGTVISVDGIGTATQGVVSYSVKVVLNTEDERILSGMSSSLTINTESQTGVIAVATAAIKTQGNRSYVEVVTDATVTPGMNLTLNKNVIERRYVEVGLADDTKTEIISGLEEGEKIIVRTTTASGSATTNTSSAPSLFGGQGAGGAPRATGGGGGNFTRPANATR